MSALGTLSAFGAVAAVAAGLALGAVYFLMLRWTVRLHVEGGSALAITALYGGRLAAALAVFWLLAQHGALALLLGLLGFLVARGLVRRLVGAP
jgi:F1F0 ATPase subunit 2